MRIDLLKFYRFIHKWIFHLGFITYFFLFLSSCKPVYNTSAAFSYIDSITPLSGSTLGGTLVTISGKGFIANDVAIIGSKKCVIRKINSTQIQCLTLPNSEGIYDLTISPASKPALSLEQAFTYYSPPLVSRVLPNKGFVAGNLPIEISGSFFRSGASVKIAGANCTGVIVISSTLITCTTPAHIAGVVDILVTNSDEQTGTGLSLYTYSAAPVVTSLSQTFGTLDGGTAITITGKDFVEGAAVVFDTAYNCGSLNFVNSTTITCTTPPHLAGTVAVTVINPDTQKGLTYFSYRLPPTVLTVAKTAGASNGGTIVKITGADFITGATVSFGGSSCIVTSLSLTEIYCTTTSHGIGTVDIVVTNLDNQSGTLLSGYTYQQAPTVTSIGTTVGPLIGGTAVTITGTNFLSGASVNFGNSACTNVVVVSSTSITCITYAYTSGFVDVTVTNTDSQFGIGASLYTYRNPPTVTALSRTSGASAGGTTLTVTGTGFMPLAFARFDGVNCTTSTYVSTTSITCITPAGGPGIVDVTVLNPDLQVGTLVAAFTFKAAPTITTASVSYGPVSGGSTFTMTGTGFESTSVVSLGGTACINSVMLSSTNIQCKSPYHLAGLVNINVTNVDTQVATLVNGYLYIDGPTVTNVGPNSGPALGGTPVTVTGTKFLPSPTVNFGNLPCTSVVYVSSTSITCLTPAHLAGAVNVTVTNTDSQVGTGLSLYTYQNAPTVTSLNKPAGALAGGTVLTITGFSFYNGASVTIGGTPCSVTSVSSTSIICTNAAHGAAVVDVVVTNLDGQSGTLTNGYTYQAAPTVTTIVINVGALAGGTPVTITGTNFVTNSTVKLGSSPCLSVAVSSPTSITCTTPAHVSGVVDIIVTNPDTQFGTGVGLFTYRAGPAITSLSVSAGPIAGGTSMTITGSGFIAGATVLFDGLACTTPAVVNSTSITCTTPFHAVGVVTVVVTNTDLQKGSLLSSYTYKAAPTVTGATSANGPSVGGKIIIITGTGFESTSIVSLDTTVCTSSLLISTTSIQCVTPAHAAGSVTVSVKNSDNQSGSLALGFQYIAAPTITSLNVSSGAEAGGDNITISGTGFLIGATVKLGTTACSSVYVNPLLTTTITCTTPAHAAGAVTVTVTNTDGQSGSLTSGFTYTPSLSWSPATPYDFGSTTTNITQTFTLTNNGAIASSAVAISLTGSGWLIGTDTCNGTVIPKTQTCTVQLTFLGALLSTGSYTSLLKASATSGGTTSVNLLAAKP